MNNPHLERRNYRDTAATFAALGFLAGLITGLAACTPQQPPCQPASIERAAE